MQTRDWQHIDGLATTTLHPDDLAWRQMRSLIGRLFELESRLFEGEPDDPVRALLDEALALAEDAAVATSGPSLTHGFCGETDPAETARAHRAAQVAIAERRPAWVRTVQNRTVIAFIRIEPWDGSTDVTATICVDADGYTIPELIVGSDGVYDAGPPHFDAYADAVRWARRQGFRVWSECDTSRDLPGRDVTPSPQPRT